MRNTIYIHQFWKTFLLQAWVRRKWLHQLQLKWQTFNSGSVSVNYLKTNAVIVRLSEFKMCMWVEYVKYKNICMLLMIYYESLYHSKYFISKCLSLILYSCLNMALLMESMSYAIALKEIRVLCLFKISFMDVLGEVELLKKNFSKVSHYSARICTSSHTPYSSRSSLY